MPILSYLKKNTPKVIESSKSALLSKGSVVTIVAALLVMIYSLQLGFIILSISLTYSCIKNILDQLSFTTIVMRAFVTLMVYVTLLQASVIAVWALYREFPLNKVVMVLTLGLALTYLYSLYFTLGKKFRAPKVSIADSRDIASAVVAVAFGVLMAVPPLLIGGADVKSSLLAVINNSVDDANHAMMINDRLQFNRGVFHHIQAASANRLEALSFYPAGWHSANAIIIQSLKPDISLGLPSLLAYGISKVFWFILLVFAFMRLLFYVHDKVFGKERLSHWTFSLAIVGGSLATYWVLTDIFNIGFYSFFPQLLAALLFAIIIVRSDDLNEQSQYGALALLSILAIGGSLSWILVLPILAVALLLYLYVHSSGKTLKKRIYNCSHILIASLVRYLPLYLLIVGATLLQLYVMSRSDHSLPFIEAITAGGRVSIYSQITTLVLSLGFTLFFLLTKTASKSMQALSALLVTSAVFCFALYMIHITEAHDPMYYFYKALYVFIIVAVPIAILGLLALIVKVRTVSSPMSTACFSIIMFIGIALLISPNASSEPTYQYAQGIRPLTTIYNKSIYNELSRSTIAHYYDKVTTVYFDENKQLHDNLSNLLVRTNKQASHCFFVMRQEVERQSSPDKQQDPMTPMMEAAKEGCFKDGYTLRIIVDDTSVKQYQEVINAMNLSSLVNLTTVTASAKE